MNNLMIMKYFTIIALLCLSCISCTMQNNLLQSPNGKIAIEYHAEKGFSVIYHSGWDKVKMMSLPEIGLKTSDTDDCFKLISSTPVTSVVDDYEMLTGKRRHCHNEANECTYRFENVKGLRVDLIFRVYKLSVIIFLKPKKRLWFLMSTLHLLLLQVSSVGHKNLL